MKRLFRSKLIQTLVVMLIIATAIFIPLSGNIKHSFADSGFHIVTSPSPGTSNQLRSITSFSANNAWAVGDTNGAALIEHWDGTSWTQQTNITVPTGAGVSLSGVKAFSATNIWAVGSYSDTNANHALILHTTDGGSTWAEDTGSYQGSDSLSAIDGDPSTGNACLIH